MKISAWCSGFVLILQLSACGGSTPETRSAPQALSASTETPQAPQAAKPKPARDAQNQALSDVFSLAEDCRQLRKRADVTSTTLNPQQIAEYIAALTDKQIEPAKLAGDSAMLVAFNTVPLNFSLKESFVELMRGQVAGLYDPEAKRMILRENLGSNEAQRLTLVHEAVHALQDQYFNLAGLMLDHSRGSGDKMAAVHALAEGDATSAMLELVLKSQAKAAYEIPEAPLRTMMSLEARATTPQAPEILLRSVLWSYLDGLHFVNALRKQGDWQLVNNAWQHPPQSTEQILHIEKYLAHEAPLLVPVPAAPGPGFEAVYSDVTGEQGLAMLFAEWLTEEKARASAAGWAGDNSVFFKKGELEAVALQLEFDTAAQAKSAYFALAHGAFEPELLSGVKAGPSAAADDKQVAHAVTKTELCQERAHRGPFALYRHKTSVAVALGPYRRDGSSLTSAGDCKAALAWTHAIAKGLLSAHSHAK